MSTFLQIVVSETERCVLFFKSENFRMNDLWKCTHKWILKKIRALRCYFGTKMKVKNFAMNQQDSSFQCYKSFTSFSIFFLMKNPEKKFSKTKLICNWRTLYQRSEWLFSRHTSLTKRFVNLVTHFNTELEPHIVHVSFSLKLLKNSCFVITIIAFKNRK